MPKSLEQRLVNLEKIIAGFFTGGERTVKKTARSAKRKAKAARKSITQKVRRRKATKTAKRRRSA